ncbi:MAG: PEP/pyruvate-binding domain-containing protein [Woeseia sp.]
MKFIRFAHETAAPDRCGNKGLRLGRLSRAGFNVPPFFVICPVANNRGSESIPGLHSEITTATRKLCPDGAPVAVRSSSVEEDGRNSSFAGQLDSYLSVSIDEVHTRVSDVRRSAFSDRLHSYRRSRGFENACQAPAVIVQRMIPAESSGVAFAVDPVTGERDMAVVAGGHGLGEGLVGGDVQGDTWRVDKRRRIVSRDIDAEDGTPVLRDRQVRQIAGLVRKVSDFFGRPQDIEWAICNGRIFLLQSRDITTIESNPSQASLALWDNSNIVESYGGVTTPLTFSVARRVYEEAYRHFGRVLGVCEQTIRNNRRTYEQMIGLIQGRVYYNLLNWYRLLMLTPGFGFNSRFMEQMMGVTQALPEEVAPKAESGGRLAGIRARAGLVNVASRLVIKLVGHERRVRNFHERIDQLLEPVELGTMSLDELIDYFEQLQSQVIASWDTPLINDLYCMIFHGALRRLCERWLGDELADSHNDLVCGEAGMVSLEPIRRMQAMARISRQDPRLAQALRSGMPDAIRHGIESNAEFKREYQAYIDRFGDRCLDELKLESKTLADDPLPMLRAVGQLATGGKSHASTLDSRRVQAERRVDQTLAGENFRRRIFYLVLNQARARIRDRENLRFERTRVYGRVRSIFLEVAAELHKHDVIDALDDIYYLDVNEIIGLVRGTGTSAQVKPLISARRREFDAYSLGDGPPRRFVTRGPAQLESSILPVDGSDTAQSTDARKGQGCSPGTVRGQVRVVRDPRTATMTGGQILVAERTDPGWVTLFPMVSGIVMERGSLLSHSAIVARELGLPAVVGVEGACRWLQDGDWVELNGATGHIRRLERTECAA